MTRELGWPRDKEAERGGRVVLLVGGEGRELEHPPSGELKHEKFAPN